MEATVSGAPQQKKNRPEGHYEGVALLRFLPLGAQFVVCVLLVIFLQGAYTYAQVRNALRPIFCPFAVHQPPLPFGARPTPSAGVALLR